MVVGNKELFATLIELRNRYPQWRFGQLVANLAGWADVDIWDVEDEELLAAARKHLDHIAHEHKTKQLDASVP